MSGRRGWTTARRKRRERRPVHYIPAPTIRPKWIHYRIWDDTHEHEFWMYETLINTYYEEHPHP